MLHYTRVILCSALICAMNVSCADDSAPDSAMITPEERADAGFSDETIGGEMYIAGQISGQAAGDTMSDPAGGLAGDSARDNVGGDDTRAGSEPEIEAGSPVIINPEDDEEREPPHGESPCVYQKPSFTLEHPRVRSGQSGYGGERSAASWSEVVELPSAYHLPPARIAHLERPRSLEHAVAEHELDKPNLDGVVWPSQVNTMPLFERALAWTGEETRCYQLGPFNERLFEAELGGVMLSEAEAYEMYVRLVRSTLWREVNQTPGYRTMIGLRGAYPGSLQWHHNAPNQFNDTIVALWRGEDGTPHVREYPVNTDTGEYDFGVDNSSSLRPNRYYPYINGWHRDYNAIQINLPSYPVRDDTNNNGHWDSERNGWLDGPEAGQDYDRLGTAHNIHAGDIDAPLSDALINIASAGCQVIPGMENWMSFLENVWTGLGDELDYFLIDVRDISPRFWGSCDFADGSHRCPHLVTSLPYQHRGDTRESAEQWHDVYSCDDADESGAEYVYVLNLPESGRLSLSVSTAGEGVDPDLHLLEGDDARACRARGHIEVNEWVPAGRYIVVVDTWVNASGVALSGEYTLNVDWSPDR